MIDLKTLSAKMLADLARDLMTEAIARIEHRQHEAFDLEAGRSCSFTRLMVPEQRAKSLQRIVLALHRNRDGIGSDQGIER